MTDETIETSRTLALPRSVEFYEALRTFPFSVAADPCAGAIKIKGADDKVRSVQLLIAPELKHYVDEFKETAITASLKEVTSAAMQFYQSEFSVEWPAEQYADKLHMLRYDVGLGFDATTNNSIAHITNGPLHGEAKKPLIELMGYGLAIVTASRILKLSKDRFVFLLGRESRPDFAATIAIEDLVSDGASTKVLTSEGFRIGLEAKARSQHMESFFKTRGKSAGEPNEILASFLQKYANAPDGDGFLGIVVTSEKRRANGSGEMRVTLADPGTPAKLDPPRETSFLLGALLPQLRRFGLWQALHSGADWLRDLEGALSPAEEALLAQVPKKGDGFLNLEEFDDTEYRGRFFSDVIRALGPIPTRQPRLRRSEIERRLVDRDAGAIWFCGARLDLLEAIESRDMSALGVLGLEGAAPATVRRRFADDAIASSVLQELARALPNAT